MKNIKLTLFLFTIALPQFIFSQDNASYEMKCEVNRVHNILFISKQKLTEAKTLIDLNSRYKSDWVKKYISVEILASKKGKTNKSASKNDTLTQEQKDLMNLVDVGTEISVKVQYIPENTLKNKEPKEMSFSFIVEPENEATFPDGKQALKEYLKQNTVDKITDGSIKRYNLAAVNFTIDEEGHVVNAEVFDTSVYHPDQDKKTDEILLQAICNMPQWKPAEYANGTKVKQKFALTVGDHESCIVNLLNIRQLPAE